MLHKKLKARTSLRLDIAQEFFQHTLDCYEIGVAAMKREEEGELFITVSTRAAETLYEAAGACYCAGTGPVTSEEKSRVNFFLTTSYEMLVDVYGITKEAPDWLIDSDAEDVDIFTLVGYLALYLGRRDGLDDVWSQFSLPEQYERRMRAENTIYGYPVTSQGRVLLPEFTLTSHLLKWYLAGDEENTIRVAKLLYNFATEKIAAKRPQWTYHVHFKSVARAFWALAERDSPSFMNAIHEGLLQHAKQGQNGRTRGNEYGHFAFAFLALQREAYRRGMALPVESTYAPRVFIEDK